MKILSIYPYTHISSAALMINGKIVAAAPEERFNRIKMSTAFPFNSINWCLKNLNSENMNENLEYIKKTFATELIGNSYKRLYESLK